MRLHSAITVAILFFAIHIDAATVDTKTPNPAASELSDVASGIARSKNAVTVPHTPTDLQIATRLQKILLATQWFENPVVESREGIVTLKGKVSKKEQREWAESLTRDTEGVIAVINSIEVPSGEWFDLRPAEQETRGLIKRALAFTPHLLASAVVLIIVAFAAGLATRLGRRAAKRKFTNVLMVELIAKVFALPVVILGLYLVLRISGLTGMAVTVVGGTGALGLIVGFALKNILENYFSGVMLSVSNPYSVGDVIKVHGNRGVVQKLTTRGTLLVDFDGNHIIIPNSTIYGNTIVNETANPSTRVKFQIGISYDESPKRVREIILAAIKEAKDVLDKPESHVLISEFGATTIIYDVFFWIDSRKSSSSRMKSLVMELVSLKLSEVFPSAEHPDASPTQDQRDARSRLSETETSIESQGLLSEASKGRTIEHGETLI